MLNFSYPFFEILRPSKEPLSAGMHNLRPTAKCGPRELVIWLAEPNILCYSPVFLIIATFELVKT